ncbi:MAG: acylphosphatase [Desulfobacteraceae bacterium]|nr:acylphosphatase [Desulfobacteraceae bacterium]
MSLEKIQIHVVISGIVQGVFFRVETAKAAKENNITGWVQNLDNGNVEAVFEGTREDVDKVVDWCHQGSASAFVNNVETKEQSPLSDFDKFEIR